MKAVFEPNIGTGKHILFFFVLMRVNYLLSVWRWWPQAFLVLSHGSFISASISACSIAIALLTLRFVLGARYPPELRRLALGWNLTSLVISIWTVYAIFKTWGTADTFVERIFTDDSFVYLLFVTGTVAAFNVWTLVLMARPIPICSGRNLRLNNDVQTRAAAALYEPT